MFFMTAVLFLVFDTYDIWTKDSSSPTAGALLQERYALLGVVVLF